MLLLYLLIVQLVACNCSYAHERLIIVYLISQLLQMAGLLRCRMEPNIMLLRNGRAMRYREAFGLLQGSATGS